MLYMFILIKNDSGVKDDETEERNKSIPVYLLFVVCGMAVIILGSNLAVDSASAIAAALGLSKRFIGLTVVALGTSLPELVTSVTAARKGNADIAIGNIVGSNIFNILFVIGLSSLIIPINFDPKFLLDGAIAIGAAVILLLFSFIGKKLSKPDGFLMLGLYVLYFVLVLV